MAEIFNLAGKRRSDELERRTLALVNHGGVLEILAVAVARLQYVRDHLSSVDLDEGRSPEEVRAQLVSTVWAALDANIELLQLAQRRYPLEVPS